MNAYYNEHDPFAAAWLRELMRDGLIAPGVVDERSIVDVQPADLAGFDRCHFFAGIGGWDYALQLAGWSGSVWTGSCPCQPFSSAARGRQLRLSDPRNLWPEWKRLIAECRPSALFGEQVQQSGDWLDSVCDDLESLDYSIGAAVLPAVAVGADHARSRIYFVGDSNSHRESSLSIDAKASWVPWSRGNSCRVVPTYGVSRGVAQMRAFGNAIVPQVAAQFIAAYMEVSNEQLQTHAQASAGAERGA